MYVRSAKKTFRKMSSRCAQFAPATLERGVRRSIAKLIIVRLASMKSSRKKRGRKFEGICSAYTAAKCSPLDGGSLGRQFSYQLPLRFPHQQNTKGFDSSWLCRSLFFLNGIWHFAAIYCIISDSYLGDVFIWCAQLSICFPGLIFTWDLDGIMYNRHENPFRHSWFLVGVFAILFAVIPFYASWRGFLSACLNP